MATPCEHFWHNHSFFQHVHQITRLIVKRNGLTRYSKKVRNLNWTYSSFFKCKNVQNNSILFLNSNHLTFSSNAYTKKISVSICQNCQEWHAICKEKKTLDGLHTKACFDRDFVSQWCKIKIKNTFF